MRAENTSAPRTDLRALLPATAALLALLAAGCASDESASPGLLEKTTATVKSAIATTNRSIAKAAITISEYQREQAYGPRGRKKEQSAGAQNPGEAQPAQGESRAAAPASSPGDRFPSRNLPAREGNAQGQASARAETSQKIPMHPAQLKKRIQEVERERLRSQDSARRRELALERKRLEDALQRAQREEAIIQEMEQLRRKLRDLQDELLELQQKGGG